MAMESKLHKCKETSQSVLECLRSKLGSGKTARKLFERLQNPEKLKFRIVRCATDLSNKICPAINLNFVQPVFSIGRIFVFTWDSTKDILLWVFLYSRIDAIQSSEVINGDFVVSMIYFNGLTIFCAQIIMGIYISNRAHKIFKLPDYFVLRIAMKILSFVLTPFMPCFLILKKTKITMEKEKMLNKWRTSSMESPINVAKTVVLYEKKVENSVKIYAMLRLIEVFMESIIQLVLLLGYLTVTIMDHHALSISENMSFSSGAVFFMFFMGFSFLTIINAIVNSIDMLKGNQLILTQKCILGFSYTCQIISRIFPVFCIVYLAIRSKISILGITLDSAVCCLPSNRFWLQTNGSF